MKRIGLVLGVLLVALSLTRAARAHDPFEITNVARIGSQSLVITTTMARSTARRMATGDGRIGTSFSPEELPKYQAKLERVAPSLLEVAAQGRTLSPRSPTARLTAENDIELVVTYDRPQGSALRVTASCLQNLPEGYTSALTAVVDEPRATLGFKILTASDPTLELVLSGQNPPAATPARWAQFRRFVVLGVEHILTGFDHLLFLGGVLLACRGARSLLAVVTCFTVAHSLTLALAAFGHVSVPGRIVEPLIALSIILVGLETLFLPNDPKRHLAVTFVFGLVHGLGLAGALADLEMRAGGVAFPLFSFNLGIELGQLAVSALLFPLFLSLRRTSPGLRGLRFASAVVTGTGLFWLCERLVAA